MQPVPSPKLRCKDKPFLYKMQLTPAQFFKKLYAKLPELKKQALDIIEVEAENFVLENFQRGEFQDTTTQVWKKRKREATPPYAPLVRTGDLKRTATTARRESDRIKFVMNQPYAQVHNEGLRAGRGKGFRMPKRQFIGNSEILNLRIKRKTTVKIAQFLKTL
jgi:phage gpG-like protein